MASPRNCTALFVFKARNLPTQILSPRFCAIAGASQQVQVHERPPASTLSSYISTFTVHIVYTQILLHSTAHYSTTMHGHLM